MTYTFSIFLMLIDLALVLLLIKRIGILNPASIFSIVVFLYGHAFLIDYILWPSNIHYPSYKLFQIDTFSRSFFYANLSYFAFLAPFTIFTIYLNSKAPKTAVIKPLTSENFNFLYYIIIIASVILLYIYLTNTYDFTRTEKNSLLTPVLFTLLATITYFWVWVVFDNQNNGVLLVSFTSIVILFFIYSFEREPILLLFLVFLFFKKKIKVRDLSLFAVLILFLALWKSFFTMIIPGHTSFNIYFAFIQSIRFSFSSLDPFSSFALLVEYFNDPGVYQNYSFSYLTNFYSQLYRMFFPSDYQSLSEYVSGSYVYGTFGLAFSMIVESFLNLWFLGPTILGLILAKIISFFTFKSKNLGNAILVIITMISIKFIRTELMTLLKLQILPAFFAFILYRFSKKKELLSSFLFKD